MRARVKTESARQKECARRRLGMRRADRVTAASWGSFTGRWETEAGIGRRVNLRFYTDGIGRSLRIKMVSETAHLRLVHLMGGIWTDT